MHAVIKTHTVIILLSRAETEAKRQSHVDITVKAKKKALQLGM